MIGKKAETIIFSFDSMDVKKALNVREQDLPEVEHHDHTDISFCTNENISDDSTFSRLIGHQTRDLCVGEYNARPVELHEICTMFTGHESQMYCITSRSNVFISNKNIMNMFSYPMNEMIKVRA